MTGEALLEDTVHAGMDTERDIVTGAHVVIITRIEADTAPRLLDVLRTIHRVPVMMTLIVGITPLPLTRMLMVDHTIAHQETFPHGMVLTPVRVTLGTMIADTSMSSIYPTCSDKSPPLTSLHRRQIL
jgi:hypothetical protein